MLNEINGKFCLSYSFTDGLIEIISSTQKPIGKIIDEQKEYNHPLTKDQFLYLISRALKILHIQFRQNFMHFQRFSKVSENFLYIKF